MEPFESSFLKETGEHRLAELPIQELFYSLQGEGSLVGTPSSFVRTSGCNLRCGFCDSPKTSWAPEGRKHTLTQLVEFCGAGPRHVVLTGGEPFLHAALVQLTRALRQRGHHVTIETAGTITREDVEADLMSISPKLSHSTPWTRDKIWAERHERRRINIQALTELMDRYPWQLKFVVRTQSADETHRDLSEIKWLLERIGVTAAERHKVFLMPECTDPQLLQAAYLTLLPVCLAKGFGLGQRLHIAMFGHRPGT